MDREDAVYLFGRIERQDRMRNAYNGDNEGYLNPCDVCKYIVLSKNKLDPAELIAEIDPSLADKYPPRNHSEFDWFAMQNEFVENGIDGVMAHLGGSDDAECWRCLFRFYGLGTETNPKRALEGLVELAEKGHDMSRDAVVFITGFHPRVYDERYPMRTADDCEQAGGTLSTDTSDNPTSGYYPMADRSLIQDSIEWKLVELLYGMDPWGYCLIPDFTNEEGGYGDSVLYTRCPDQYEPGPPALEFRPSGYCMNWYKTSWRSPEQSENLSIGEILKIFRLLIEHKAMGREIPAMSTRDALSLPVLQVEVPVGLRDRVDRICKSSKRNLSGLISVSFMDTYSPSPDQMAESIIRRFEREGNRPEYPYCR